MSVSDFELGQKAQLTTDNSVGTVRYIGEIHVAKGDFIGIELPTPTGKNDGSVQGTRYFKCQPNHGIFVKLNAVKPYLLPSASPVPVVKKAPRPSLAPTTATASKKPATSRLSMAPPTTAKRQSLAPSTSRAPATGKPLGGPSGKLTPVGESQQQQLGRPTVNFDVENEELKAKLSVLESRRDEREALLSAAVADKERYAGIVQKLEAKLKPLSDELQESRTAVRDYKESQRQAQHAQEEFETTVESLALDRELALEMNDKLKHEVEELKTRIDELELQNEIYREENALEREGSEEEHNPQNIVHLQVENKRMREALLRLRDITTSEKQDLESQVRQFQEDLVELPEIKKQNDELQQQISKAEDIIEHQKGQIDSSEDNETFIMDMQNKLQANTDRVAELEALVETNNESEEINEKIINNLEEAQRSTQAELDHYKALFQAATERIVIHERTIADQDDTVEKYRRLTSTLQSNLREAQGSHEISQQEKVVAEKRAQHLQDLAKETKRSTERTQLRDYEQHMVVLGRKLAQKELNIVKTYIPESYKILESSTQSLLIMNSINGKIQALKDLLRAKTSELLTDNYNSNKIIRPLLITQLGYLDLLTEQFDENFTHAPLPSFIKLGELNNELHSMDKAVDTWIDGLIKDSLVETQILEQVKMYVKFLDNIAEVHMPENPQNTGSSPDCALDYTRQLHHIEHDLASLQVFLNYLKEMFIKHLDIDFEADELDREQYDEHSSALIKMRNTQEAIFIRESRMLITWQELKQRNMTINEKVEEKIYLSRKSLTEALNMVQNCCLDFSRLVNEEREHELTILDLRPVIGTVPYENVIQKLTESLKYISNGKDLMDSPECLNEVLEESIQPPWITHNILLKDEEVDVQDLTRQLTATKLELNERNTTIAVNKKTIEELNVNVEIMNKRINDSGAKNDRAIELEKALHTSSNRVNALNQKVQNLEEQLKQALTERQQTIVKTPTITSKLPMPVTASIDTSILKRQVANLESTVRDIHMAKRQQISIIFEPLQLEKKKRESNGLADRAGKTMKAAMDRLEMDKKENRKAKKTSMVKRKLMAEQALNGFRRALHH